jgi:hypothetical protein
MKGFMSKFSWVWLSAFRTTSVLKVGYAGVVVVPLISYVIELINSIGLQTSIVLQTIAPGGAQVKINLVLPEPLFWLFAGSISLSFAHFLNETLCPQIIRSYSGLDNYLANIASYVKNEKIILRENKEREQKIADSSVIKDEFPTLPADVQQRLSGEIAEVLNENFIESTSSDGSILNYRNVWKAENESKWFARLVILIFYTISMVIAVLLLFRQLRLVFRVAFPEISLVGLFFR